LVMEWMLELILRRSKILFSTDERSIDFIRQTIIIKKTSLKS
jgi:hypothetical protein